MRRTHDLAISQLAQKNAIRRHAGLCILLAASTGTTADELQPDHPRRHVTGDAFVRGTLQVAGGNEQSARKYYRDIVAPQMKFETTETIENSSIRHLLAYFGYPDINARDSAPTLIRSAHGTGRRRRHSRHRILRAENLPRGDPRLP